MSARPAIVEFQEVSRGFYGVKVLDQITFSVPAGATLGLIGENGAGKSTLMNILGGNLAPDRGTILLDGQPHAPASPRDAARAGVAFVHQELNLFPNLTIAENIFLGAFPRTVPWLPWIARSGLRQRTRRLLEEMRLEQDPDTPVERLSAGERQLVEIAKALQGQARVLILDEPTTSLTEPEAGRLFEIMGRLRARGITMIYISHHLGHIRQWSDRVVILRDGRVAGEGSTRDLSVDQMVSLMVGREITQFYPKRATRPHQDVVLDVERLHQPGTVRRMSFQLRRGEVLGISGLMGSGRSELARILFGLDPCAEGDVRLGGRSLRGLPPRERIRLGMAFLTEDRRADGLCADASLADNLALVALPRLTRGPWRWVDTRQSETAVSRIRAAVQLGGAAGDAQPVRTLSGGNQQKVVLGKWLLNEPKVFILDEPTRGIDVGARFEIYRLINDLAARGAGVLMISSEVEELIGMCDRIMIMSRGEVREVMEPDQFDRERILRAALHGEKPA